MDAENHARRLTAHRHQDAILKALVFPAVLVAGLLAVILPAAAVDRPGTLLSAHRQSVMPRGQIEREAVGFFEMHSVPRMLHDVEVWTVSYVSEDFNGAPVDVKAQLFIPVVPGGGEIPLLVFGSGTSGLSDSCAPSLELPEIHRFGWYTANMLSYAGVGFIVIFPDYIGFNDPDRVQRYFSKQAEAHAMLDGARAAISFTTGRAVRAAPRVFAAGFSQGGHAAFAAADLRASYAPDVPLSGVIGFGATCDVTPLLREGPVYAPFILYAWSQMYGTGDVDPSQVLQPHWASRLAEDAATMCVDTFQNYYPWDPAKLYRTDFLQELNNNHIVALLPRLAARIEENKAGLSGHGIPALVVQGTGDIVVTTPTQDRYVAALRASGSAVRYVVLPMIKHRFIRQAGFPASVDWMLAIARGDPAPSDKIVP